MSNTYISSLYLFSSLLQADAAIIGLGAIFIIYKLQSMDSNFQNALRLCMAAGYGEIGDLAKFIVITEDANKKRELLKRAEGQMHYDQLKLLITIPERKISIKHSAKWPLIFLAIHISATTILLALIPKFISSFTQCEFSFVFWTITITFIFLITYITIYARSIISNE
jgi:hypothetical protein